VSFAGRSSLRFFARKPHEEDFDGVSCEAACCESAGSPVDSASSGMRRKEQKLELLAAGLTLPPKKVEFAGGPSFEVNSFLKLYGFSLEKIEKS